MSLTTFDDTIDHLKTRWADADKNFLRQLFPLIADGRPISPSRFAQITQKNVATVELELLKGNIDRDSEGNIIELFGITQAPTLHRIRLGEVFLFSCCALVAHMVPLLLDRPATIESVDPVSHRLTTIQVSSSGIHSLEPQRAVGTLVVTTQEQVLNDVRSAFCMHVCHFPDQETAEEFIAADSRRYLISITDLHNAARQLTDALWC